MNSLVYNLFLVYLNTIEEDGFKLKLNIKH